MMKGKLIAAASGALIASTMTASAAFLDFTDEDQALSGSFGSVNFTVVGTNTIGGITSEVPGGQVNQDTTAPLGGLPAPLAGDYDGLGIRNDELTNGTKGIQAIKISFTDEFGEAVRVRLKSTYFLDLFFANGLEEKDLSLIESGLISVGDVPTDPADATLLASVPSSEGIGFGVQTDVLIGSSFTFFAGEGKDDNSADIALAAIEVSAIPLPAGMLLMGTALGGLGLMRRRKKA